MIDLHYWPTPNGHKITMFLEETSMPYTIMPVNIGKGEQFQAEFLAISPNNRMPAIVDHTPLERGAPISVHPERCTRACRGAAMVVLAGRGLGSHAGTKPSLQPLCAGENSVCHRSLCEGNQPAVRRAQQTARGPRVRGRCLLDCRYGGVSVDRAV
jgi:hypothetical protein